MSYLFGVDIGGTKIAVAAVSFTRHILARTELETRAADGASLVIARLIAALHSLQQDDNLLASALGVPDPLTRSRVT